MVRDGVPARRYPFEPRLDDTETLWEVHEITQESDTQYKVRWVGTDPQTGKPWAESWVPKSDCTDEAVQQWEVKRKLGRKNGVVGEKPVVRPKRKRQADEDTTRLFEVPDEAFGKTVEAQPGKKKKQEVDEEDAPLDVTYFDTHSSLKVGPPRGVRKRHPTNSQPFSPGPSPAVRLNGGSAKATVKTGKGPANCPSEQKPSAPERQLSRLSESSDEGTLPKAQPNFGTATVSASKLSGASGRPGPSDKALEGYKVQFTGIAANILTLHGLVKKVDVQLEEAMRELRELEASFQ